jgi:hypothetical protein
MISSPHRGRAFLLTSVGAGSVAAVLAIVPAPGPYPENFAYVGDPAASLSIAVLVILSAALFVVGAAQLFRHPFGTVGLVGTASFFASWLLVVVATSPAYTVTTDGDASRIIFLYPPAVYPLVWAVAVMLLSPLAWALSRRQAPSWGPTAPA